MKGCYHLTPACLRYIAPVVGQLKNLKLPAQIAREALEGDTLPSDLMEVQIIECPWKRKADVLVPPVSM